VNRAYASPAPASCRYRAPARVNVIGEHTDYNDGFVLPTTTALYTNVHASARTDRIVEVSSANFAIAQAFDLDDIQAAGKPQWIDYAKGVAAEIEATGIRLPGANLRVTSEIPLGGGLSSSASFELAVAGALLDLAGASLPGFELAKLCQRAENRYTGVSCGIMDQFAVSCCARGNALLLDCRSLAVRQVPIPQSARLLLTHSGVDHRLADGAYNNRADECRAAVRHLAREVPSVTSLRNLDLALLEAWQDRLGERLFRRCRHVVSENQRVLEAHAAMLNDDLEQLGAQLSASHASLRDDYEVSCAEVDRLVDIADNAEGVTGSRMIGAGFGGCVLSIVHAGKIDAAARQISRQYARETGSAPWMHVVAAAPPARKIDQAENAEP
jgi:galactokinase